MSRLLLIPCSGSKEPVVDGNKYWSPVRPGSMSYPSETFPDRLTGSIRYTMQKTRDGVRKRFSDRWNREGGMYYALNLYTGITYQVPHFKWHVWKALKRGWHVLIVSGGYGIILPNERSHKYNVTINETWRFYKTPVELAIKNYIYTYQIQEIYISLSQNYRMVLPAAFPVPTWWFVPKVSGMRARREVPYQIGYEVKHLLKRDAPNDIWTKVEPGKMA